MDDINFGEHLSPVTPTRNGLDVQVAIQRGQVADFTWPLRVETPSRRLHTVEVAGSIPATPTTEGSESSEGARTRRAARGKAR
jgi:hypothetical protein